MIKDIFAKSKKQNNDTNNENTNLIIDKDTAIVEYFELIQNEYNIERNKKESFESRSGLILALLGTISIFLFERIQLKDILPLIHAQLTFTNLIKIISCVFIYISFTFTMIMIIKTITVQQHDNFSVKNIDEELINTQRIHSLCKIIFTYRDIIIQHRQMNQKRAINFRNSLYGISFMIGFIIIYTIV